LPPECQKTWSIFEDSTGKVWITSLASGLFFYDRIEKEWGHYTSENLLSHKSLRFVFQDKEKHLWVGSSGGSLMQFQEPRFSSYGIERNLTEPRVISLSADTDGNIFTATFGGGIQALIDNAFQSIPSDEKEGNFPQSILVDTEQRIWAGTLEHGLFQKAKNSATFAHQKT
jgi:ligand-binding sensor domain-containing protein